MGVPLSHPVMDQVAGWCETQALCSGYAEEAPRNHCIVRYQRIRICIIMYIRSIELLDRGLYRTDHIFRGSRVFGSVQQPAALEVIDLSFDLSFGGFILPYNIYLALDSRKRSPIRIIRAATGQTYKIHSESRRVATCRNLSQIFGLSTPMKSFDDLP